MEHRNFVFALKLEEREESMIKMSCQHCKQIFIWSIFILSVMFSNRKCGCSMLSLGQRETKCDVQKAGERLFRGLDFVLELEKMYIPNVLV